MTCTADRAAPWNALLGGLIVLVLLLWSVDLGATKLTAKDLQSRKSRVDRHRAQYTKLRERYRHTHEIPLLEASRREWVLATKARLSLGAARRDLLAESATEAANVRPDLARKYQTQARQLELRLNDLRADLAAYAMRFGINGASTPFFPSANKYYPVTVHDSDGNRSFFVHVGEDLATWMRGSGTKLRLDSGEYRAAGKGRWITGLPHWRLPGVRQIAAQLVSVDLERSADGTQRLRLSATPYKVEPSFASVADLDSNPADRRVHRLLQHLVEQTNEEHDRRGIATIMRISGLPTDTEMDLPSVPRVEQLARIVARDSAIDLDLECYQRAHLALDPARRLGVGWRGKVWLFGHSDSRGEHRPRAGEEFDTNRFMASRSDWGYHVAPFVLAKDPDSGEPKILVVDKKVHGKTLTLADWIPTFTSEPAVIELTDEVQFKPAVSHRRPATFEESMLAARRRP